MAGVIQLANGQAADYEKAACGHQYKVPVWAVGHWPLRARCDYCSSPKERAKWDARALAPRPFPTLKLPHTAPKLTLPVDTTSQHPLVPQPRLSAYLPRKCAHPDCEAEFRTGRLNQRCCCPKHNAALYRIEHPSQRPPDTQEAKRERWQRRRALKKGARTGPVESAARLLTPVLRGPTH